MIWIKGNLLLALLEIMSSEIRLSFNDEAAADLMVIHF